MLFNSFSFAIFLPIVFAIYWLLPHKFRWILLLIASYYFYMSWNVKYVILILFTTAVSYFAAIYIEKAKDKKRKKCVLIWAALLCLGVLFFFKYFNFATESISNILSLFTIQISPLTINLLLPVGISFYTFQTLSYVIDVYKGEVKAERHFGYYATFISFFPQLVAGPIERTRNLLPQIKERHLFDYSEATYGLKLMAWGYFKKIVIADTLSRYVGTVYDNPQQFTGFSLVLASLFFTIQIYCDFSGYSDIAVGTAKLLGINLMNNFQSPYFSQSVKEFWSRWHISLSTWFRDYIYIPMGGNRVGKAKKIRNLMVTFLVSGLWHGANWTYVVWGGLHGLAQSIENLFVSKKKQSELTGRIKWGRVALVFMFSTVAWVFFVSNSLSDAIYVFQHAFDGISAPLAYLRDGFSKIYIDWTILLKMVVMIIPLGIYDYVSLKKDVIIEIGKKSLIKRWTIYVILLLVIVFFSQKGIAAEFVYFQF
ncbi:MAG: MBOAT family protein [Lachnospiraceae bacterium]|nr:MBOAT family protein [Lachnospiraceae bacterium]